MPRLRIFATIVLCIISRELSHTKDTSDVTTNELELAGATNDFSINLFKAVLQENSGNVVISPISVSSLLAIIQQGAYGSTREQLTQVLGLDAEVSRQAFNSFIHNLLDSGFNGLEFANGLFLKRRLVVDKDFETMLLEDFNSYIKNVNFVNKKQSVNVINSWVSKETQGFIKTLISQDNITPDTAFVLINAIFFKSLWKTPFIEKYTKNQVFYKDDKSEVSVPMMLLDGYLKSGYHETLKAEWVEIPFQGERFSLLVLMPFEKFTLNTLINDITPQAISRIISNLTSTFQQRLLLSLPKFKLSGSVNLVQILKKLGLSNVFSDDANLSGISRQNLKVSQMIQGAEFDVDEKGVTAAAATDAEVVTVSAPFSFTIDHSFLFFIIDKENSIPLFVGRVSDPSMQA